MNKILSFQKSILFHKFYTMFLLIFLFLLGSHFLDYHLYIFIILGIFLLDWRYITSKNFLLVSALILSIYITWIFLDPSLLHQWYVFLPGMLILLMYLLGLSIKIKREGSLLISDKRIFYILFTFVISYSFFVLWSYFTIPQDNPLTGLGMHVCFPNPYKRLNVNGGRLISTILTYYLTLMTFTLPLILFYFNKLRKQGFYIVELFLLIALSLFVLYISAIMGRRTVFVLFSLVFIFLFVTYVIASKHIKKVLLLLTLITAAFYGIHTFSHDKKEIPELKAIIMADNLIIPIVSHSTNEVFNFQNISVFNKLSHKGLKDSRFSWWEKSFHIMLNHPYGGGHVKYVAHGMKLTHNVWLDMGKDYGIIPFVLLLIVTLLHIYYLIRIFFSKRVKDLLKYQLLIIGMGLFAIMLIEPVFNSDKTFFAYIFFYFGIVASVHSNMKTKLLGT